MSADEDTKMFTLCGFGFHDLPPLEAVRPEDPNDPHGDGKAWPPMFVTRRCTRCGEDLAGLDMNPWYKIPGGSHRRKIDWRTERRYAVSIAKITLGCAAVLIAVAIILQLAS